MRLEVADVGHVHSPKLVAADGPSGHRRPGPGKSPTWVDARCGVRAQAASALPPVEVSASRQGHLASVPTVLAGALTAVALVDPPRARIFTLLYQARSCYQGLIAVHAEAFNVKWKRSSGRATGVSASTCGPDPTPIDPLAPRLSATGHAPTGQTSPETAPVRAPSGSIVRCSACW
ncbi:hypothetical protein BN381_10261 [Candidatus Microthrix parvicella RN1]|uniref:Uncharacterized protein n=1 Tax=Candidatus Neomicrothrix parvicella RN1 TaxID=1229780 RepID=R4YW07_9ACTN|nr:hypothetical protein BN381_10261 [Candidatus Microthrix parvicella RN1]